MKREELFQLLGEIDEEFIEEALLQEGKKDRERKILSFGKSSRNTATMAAAAAAAVLAIGISGGYLLRMPERRPDTVVTMGDANVVLDAPTASLATEVRQSESDSGQTAAAEVQQTGTSGTLSGTAGTAQGETWDVIYDTSQDTPLTGNGTDPVEVLSTEDLEALYGTPEIPYGSAAVSEYVYEGSEETLWTEHDSEGAAEEPVYGSEEIFYVKGQEAAGEDSLMRVLGPHEDDPAAAAREKASAELPEAVSGELEEIRIENQTYRYLEPAEEGLLGECLGIYRTGEDEMGYLMYENREDPKQRILEILGEYYCYQLIE